MTIKGTLETFNLLDLLQMLAFNQKVGTLMLETARGPRTLYIESGAIGFVQGDENASTALARVLRRANSVAPDRLQRGLSINANSGRFLGDALADLGVLDAESRVSTWLTAVQELFFDLLQTSLTRFEFVEHKRLAPSGAEGDAIQPLCGVDGLLLDLTRKCDEWGMLRQVVAADEEIYEGTGVAATEPAPEDRLPDYVAARVLPLVDGRRTVTALVAESDCDRFSVVKLVAVLLKQGALRVSSTNDIVHRAEDLLGRSEAAKAVPLFRRAVERGEAPADIRIRLADALEAAGDLRGAAAELDTYASECAEKDPVGVFDSLRRTMRLRSGDASTAARICDHFLRHHARLADRSADASEALRRLIHAASTGGKPLDAAARLQPFLDQGDAPSEDLLVLADLYAAGGKPQEAASALFRRAEDLVAAGRPTPARDLLRRALGYDATRADARRRLGEIEGAERRRRHKRRVVVLLLLIGLVVGSAGGVYLAYDGRTAKTVDQALAKADDAVKDADAQAAKVLAAWSERLAAAAVSTTEVKTLSEAAATLRSETNKIAITLRGMLSSVAGEIGNGQAGLRGDAGLARLRGLEARMRSLVARADASVKDAGDRSAKALADGEQAYASGKFRSARRSLMQAINLGFEDGTRVARARQRLELVASYEGAFASANGKFEAALGKGDLEEAWKMGCGLFATLLDSDLTHDVLLPVPVASDPPGAALRIGHETQQLATPCTLRYSPFGDLDLHLRSPGRVPASFSLPSFKQICEGEAAGGTKPHTVFAKLDEGPRWIANPRGGVAGPFPAGEGILAVTAEGRRLLAIKPSDGEATEARGIAAPADRVRRAGHVPSATWMLVGQRTFAYLPDGEKPWQYQTTGRLERAPAVGLGLVVLVDETGTVYGLDASHGTLRWKRPLPSEPSQAPYASPLGFLVATVGGDAVAVDPATGEAKMLVPPARQAVLVVPWVGGVLVLGGGKGGARRIAPDLTVAVLADADVLPGSTACLGKDGIAWVAADGGVRWLGHTHADLAHADPVLVAGLAAPASAPIAADGFVYAVDAAGVLKAVRIEAPGEVAWRTQLPGAVQTELSILGDLILVRTDRGIVAVER